MPLAEYTGSFAEIKKPQNCYQIFFREESSRDFRWRVEGKRAVKVTLLEVRCMKGTALSLCWTVSSSKFRLTWWRNFGLDEKRGCCWVTMNCVMLLRENQQVRSTVRQHETHESSINSQNAQLRQSRHERRIRSKSKGGEVCFGTLSIVLFLFKAQKVLETGFCPDTQ
jgi:hypothetical protein